jgi:hypothetical protein
MPDSLPEFHLYEDLSLTPAYVMGYAFHALGRIDRNARVHGRRGALVLLNELLATLRSLNLEASLLAAVPLRMQLLVMALRPRSSRIGSVSTAKIVEALAVVESCVRVELRARAVPARPPPPSAARAYHSRVVLGEATLGQCPNELRWEITEACRALDAGLYTAAVFHLHRVWEALSDGSAPTSGSDKLSVADPRIDLTLRCSEAHAASALEAVRRKLENLRGPPASLE